MEYWTLRKGSQVIELRHKNGRYQMLMNVDLCGRERWEDLPQSHDSINAQIAKYAVSEIKEYS